jgi:hypothetical protein
MRSDQGGRRGVCQPICMGSMRDQIGSPSWSPLLALIWGARSRDPVQVSYRCMQTLTSLGLYRLRVAILFLGCSRYTNSKDPRGRSLVRAPKSKLDEELRRS